MPTLPTMPDISELPAETQLSVLASCNACADACNHCAASCLREPELPMMARCIALDIDCADLCRTLAVSLARGSEWARPLATVCAELCDACAMECSRHAQGHCQCCADACRRCAEDCRLLAS